MHRSLSYIQKTISSFSLSYIQKRISSLRSLFDYHSDLNHKGGIVRDERRDEIDKELYRARDEIDQKEYTDKFKFSQVRAKDYCIQTLLHTYKNQKNNLIPQTKEVF